MDNYSDIINLPYQKSLSHKHMSNSDRAAQFAPFAALTGYEELVKETARVVNHKKEISLEKKEELSNKLIFLSNLKGNEIDIHITHFIKDKKKEGGTYKTSITKSIKLDLYKRRIRLDDGELILINDIYEIESSLFDKF